MDEDDCKIKEDFEACQGAAMSPHAPLCQLGFSKRNEESKSRQLKRHEDFSKEISMICREGNVTSLTLPEEEGKQGGSVGWNSP